MKKYLAVFRLSFKMQIIWRFDVAMTMVATVGRIIAAWILWRAVFDGKEYVSGFTFQTMLSYYIISSFLTSLDMSNQISGEVSHLIQNGGFSKHMVTPMNPFGFFSSMVLGESTFHLGFGCIAAFICSVCFRTQIVFSSDIIQILLAVVMVLSGLLFMICFHYFLGILTFKFLNIRSITFISNHLIAFVTGALVPLALLPDSVQNIMRLFPFYYVTYLPAMLLTGRSSNEAVTGIITLVCWITGLLVINFFIYNRLRIKYDGVGI